TMVNDAFVKMLNTTRARLLGMDINTIRFKPIIEPIRRSVEGETTKYNGEYYATTSDAEIWADCEFSPIYDEAGQIVGGMGVIVDITRQKQDEQELRLQKAYMDDLFEGAPEGIVLLDLDDTVLRVNKGFTNLFGYSQDEAVGRQVNDLIVKEGFYEEASTLTRLAGRGELINTETLRYTKDGRKIDVSILATPILAGDEFVAIYGIYRDISARKRADKIQKLLFNISEATTSTRDLRELLDVIRTQLGVLIDTTNFHVILYNEETDVYTLTYSADVKDSYSPDESLKLKGSLTDLTRRTGRSHWIDRRTFDKLRKSGEVELIGTPATIWIGVPLKTSSGVIGVASVQSYEEEHGFTFSDLELLEFVSEHIALAIERKMTHDELAYEKEWLGVTLRSLGEGVVTADINGRILMMNRFAEKLTGWSEMEAKGRAIDMIYRVTAGDTPSQQQNPVDQVLQSRGVVTWSHKRKLIDREGNYRFISDSAAPIRDQSSEIIGVVIIFRDITQELDMEEELLKARKLESIGVLAGGIAHDFNNILAGILGHISLARVGMMSESYDEVNERLAAAEKASLRARDLTQQLLTFSKGGAPVRKMASIKEIIEETTQFALRGSNVKSVVNIDDDLWPAKVDEGQINQVIHNLVINANQAMPEGGTLKVEALNYILEKKGNLPIQPGRFIRIKVRDNGVGIPADNLARIFDPYFTTKKHGSGLGLATSFSIIAKHEGHITVDSEIGVGTEFTIYLPAGRETEEIGVEEVRVVRSTQGDGKVLIVDDELMVLNVAEGMLKHMGFDVVRAMDGEEAIALYKAAREESRDFDVVIMDLTIPGGLGGKETVKRLREMGEEVIAVASSGYSNDPVMARYRDYGFDAVISKPYTVEDLEKTLFQVLHRDS
ncbi:PAS domain S-box protein, partial [bacterium]|nr:PAS domain S-box protein [bacterium]